MRWLNRCLEFRLLVLGPYNFSNNNMNNSNNKKTYNYYTHCQVTSPLDWLTYYKTNKLLNSWFWAFGSFHVDENWKIIPAALRNVNPLAFVNVSIQNKLILPSICFPSTPPTPKCLPSPIVYFLKTVHLLVFFDFTSHCRTLCIHFGVLDVEKKKLISKCPLRSRCVSDYIVIDDDDVLLVGPNLPLLYVGKGIVIVADFVIRRRSCSSFSRAGKIFVVVLQRLLLCSYFVCVMYEHKVNALRCRNMGILGTTKGIRFVFVFSISFGDYE